MKKSYSPEKTHFTKHCATLFIFLLTFLPAAFCQMGSHTPWIWKKGLKGIFDYGNYGTLGVEAPGNLPPSMEDGSTFKDKSGNLWLFGGFFVDGFGGFSLSSLWKYNPVTNNWTWVKGDGSANYGTIGVPALSNQPGPRAGAASWVDKDGNFWLFGGIGYDANNSQGLLNDLWKYDVSTNIWIWVSGSSFRNNEQASTGPQARSNMAFWADNLGNLWIYGGAGLLFGKNDLWKYNIAINTWTWIKGSITDNEPANYGTKGVATAANSPGARSYTTSWIDASNNLYLFGGVRDEYFTYELYNDLWQYIPETNQWTWINGDNVPNRPPVKGIQGVSHPQNNPGARISGSALTDMQGNFWLFGGNGVGTLSDNRLNDLWKYSPATNQWTWMKGGDVNAYGIYGTQGVPDTANKPGGRYGAMSWSAPFANFWFIGGAGYGELDEMGNGGAK